MLRELFEKYDLKARVKGFFKNMQISDNAFGYCCPTCSSVWPDRPSAFVHRIFDENYHCYKKYIKCEDCGRTSPAYENIADAVSNWDDQFILEEDLILLENDTDSVNI